MTSTRKSADTEPTDATVSDIADARVDLDLDAEPDVDLRPFVFRLGGRDWEVPRPGVAQTLDAENAITLSDFFEIIMGEAGWEEFEPVFREERDANKTWKLGRAISRHFGMDPASVEKAAQAEDAGPRNRFQRRQDARRPRRV